MDILVSKRLAGFIGVCWHEPELKGGSYGHGNLWTSYLCKKCGKKPNILQPNPDFTNSNGWQRIADEIEKRESWNDLYQYLVRAEALGDNALESGIYFHESLSPAQKSAIVAAWREEIEK